MNIKNNLILALDVMNESDAIEICDSIKEYIDTIKIGYPLALAEGLEIINKLKNKFGFKVICDFKVADIDATNSKICDETFKAGADAIICHGFVGEDSVQACLNMANKHGKELFLLTEMSHPGAKMFLQKNADAIAQMGVDMGITNYVAPATRLDRLSEIRNIVGNESYIISPGVGKQGGDGKKTLEYSNAIIVGRSIYESEKPKTACKNLIESLK
ncbi:orotidine-5'-phosphate decarboxylase [Methanobrevibacter gottschalkii]|uniref:Orotidine 5'-phosphate decarboxylase n=2 Tax=Methanobrevibacter gottschalkii TaxID=190974 RepID=A0A3N5C107_9EURY|nr:MULTISPECIES: orotidine-5'-phosphate decarboxylase [Methanobrevibacter]OEC95235.1 orotidine 5'-phosphate decarboxylase [Methanobrevibacter sp. A27]RPF51805.1 orotidine-5'-phosphate decarboxylase [Methanobrevibacter gottschalkii DSM 11977]SEK95715.1 orotidine-5'-phosphate decarboxylase [Methanobrevibacter gottschalkii]